MTSNPTTKPNPAEVLTRDTAFPNANPAAMKTKHYPQTVPRLVHRQVNVLSTQAGRSATPEMTGALNPFFRSRLAAVRRWAGELSYLVVTNRYVFYGSLILAGSLIAGAATRGQETLWRFAAAIGLATVVVGLVHAWLDARLARRSRRAHTKGRVKEM